MAPLVLFFDEDQVTYSYGQNGIIHVDVFDVTSQQMIKTVELDRKSNLSKEEIIEKKNKISHMDIV